MVTISDGQLPWVIGLSCAIAVMAGSLLVLAWDSILKRRERMRRGRAIVAKTMAPDHDAEILAVAEQALEERPELFDDDAATVLRALSIADGAEAAFVSPGHPDADALLAALFPRSKNAPKEGP